MSEGRNEIQREDRALPDPALTRGRKQASDPKDEGLVQEEYPYSPTENDSIELYVHPSGERIYAMSAQELFLAVGRDQLRGIIAETERVVGETEDEEMAASHKYNDVSGGCTLSLSNLSLVNGRAGFSLEECSLDTEAQTLNMLASMLPAGCDGGALLATLSSSELVTADAVSISRTKFENCSAKGRGGAVQILYEGPFGGDVTMDGASFDGCSSGSGASGVCRDCSRTSRKPV